MIDTGFDSVLYKASVWVLPVLVAITLHEAAHGFVAWRLGDDTAYEAGRVTFNPMRHVDPFGTIVLPALLLHVPRLYPLHPNNAHIESFTIHVRQLIDFFWPEHPRGTDAPAAAYFDPGEWEKLALERPEILSEAIRKKIGWGVAHLTYDRAWARPEEKPWDVVGLARALAPVIVCFVDNVDHSKLDPRFPPALMNPRTLCACPPVAAIRSFRVTPVRRCSNRIITAVLLSTRSFPVFKPGCVFRLGFWARFRLAASLKVGIGSLPCWSIEPAHSLLRTGSKAR